MAPILAFSEAYGDYTALRIQSRPSLGYEVSFGTSLAKVDRLGEENNCVKQTDRLTDITKYHI